MGKLTFKYIEAGQLNANPANWRTHSPEQLQSLRDLIADPGVGWAGACLYNERTGRLIDGHARREVSDPKELIPVLCGDWDEAAELKILATLDPIGAMAGGDPVAYAKLVEQIEAESLWIRDVLHNTAAELSAASEEEGAEEEGGGTVLPAMEAQPFEHHDYLMLMFKNEQDFQGACDRLGIQRVSITYPGGRVKTGLGRVIDGATALRMLLDQKSATVCQTGTPSIEVNSSNVSERTESVSLKGENENRDTVEGPGGNAPGESVEAVPGRSGVRRRR